MTNFGIGVKLQINTWTPRSPHLDLSYYNQKYIKINYKIYCFTYQMFHFLPRGLQIQIKFSEAVHGVLVWTEDGQWEMGLAGQVSQLLIWSLIPEGRIENTFISNNNSEHN